MYAIAISTLVVAVTLWLVARHQAEIQLHVILVIAVATSVIGGVLGLFVGPLALPVMMFLLGWALVRFCYVSIPQAAIVVFAWLVANIGLALALQR